MSARSRPTSGADGFTLLELVVAFLIFTAVGMIGFRVLSSTSRSFQREVNSASVNENLAAAKNLLADDLSIAGYSGFNAAAPYGPVSQMFKSATTGTTSDAVSFEGDLSSTGVVQRVCYQVSGAALQRKIVATGTACGSTGYDTLVGNVSVFTLTFLDKTRAALTATQVTADNNARYVGFRLTVSSGAVTKTAAGEVALRNW